MHNIQLAILLFQLNSLLSSLAFCICHAYTHVAILVHLGPFERDTKVLFRNLKGQLNLLVTSGGYKTRGLNLVAKHHLLN